MNALIVENSKVYRQLLSGVLSEFDVAAEPCDCIERGLNLATRDAFDLICVGLHLRDGTGIEFAQRYHELDVNAAPILLLTSSNEKTAPNDWFDAGITEFFIKDDVAHLRRQIGYFVDRHTVRSLEGRRVLYVEDSRSLAARTIALLERLGLDIDHHTSAESAFEQFENRPQHYDLVITDLVLEDHMSGQNLVRAIRHLEFAQATRDPLPILAVTGFDDNTRRIQLFRTGIDDYITKPVIAEELAARITQLVMRKSLLDTVRKQQRELETLANTDALTGLSNRRSLMEYASRYIAQAIRHSYPLSLLLLDLDHFKRVNDEHGHDTGDSVLRDTGRVLGNSFRTGDLSARFGGEEFVVLLPYCAAEHAVAKAETLREAIARMRSQPPEVTASIGVACLDGDARTDFDALFKAADHALYEAKRNGRNRVCRAP